MITPSPLPSFSRLASALLLCALAGPVLAEKADRGKPMEVLADKSGTADLQNQVSRFSGNVVITQGTMVIKADRVEIRQTPDGFHVGTAWGAAGAPVSYRQKRDGVRRVRRRRGRARRVRWPGRGACASSAMAWCAGCAARETVDEITGTLITWNHGSEQFSVQGGTPTAANPSGRVRAVLSPRPGSAAAESASRPATGRPEPR
jgi:lipopolysaccharide export system protein LptA